METMSKSLYFARQPILDINSKTYAYELLYRSSTDKASASIVDDHVATAQVLVNTLNFTNLEHIVGDSLAFINIDREMLMNEMLLSIPKEKFVLELLENIVIDDEIIRRIKSLKQHGYRFALDDADCTKEYFINFQPIFEYIDILKLDIRVLSEEQVSKFLPLFKKFDLTLLAEKVETQEEFDTYKKLGCDLFQGFFFAKPDIIENKELDPKQLSILQLIRMLQDNAPVNDICQAFEQNAALTIQLLRFINSASFSFKASIKSIRQAVMLLGPSQLKSWLLLTSYATSKSPKGIENPLLHLAQTRSNMMKVLYQEIYQNNSTKENLERASFVGLLSLIEALLNIPMEDVLNELNVDDEIINTLMTKEGTMGDIFKLVCAVEQFDTQKIELLLETLSLSGKQLAESIQTSYEITENFSHTFQA